MAETEELVDSPLAWPDDGVSELPSLSKRQSTSTTAGLVRSVSLTGGSIRRTLSRQPSTASNMHREELGTGVPFGAVIHFTTYAVAQNFSRPWKVQEAQESTGTGFVLSVTDRHILTNSHVVRNGTRLSLERHGRPGNFEGRVLCESEISDLALVTVDDDDFWADIPAVKLSDAVPALDDTVVAVGYPLGAKSVTVTRGVVSNVHLKDLSLKIFGGEQMTVQIDAAINPGNSGGPVFNVTSFALVGVAFAGRTGAEGQGFIIPIPVVKNFLRIFKETRKPNPGRSLLSIIRSLRAASWHYRIYYYDDRSIKSRRVFTLCSALSQGDVLTVSFWMRQVSCLIWASWCVHWRTRR